MKRLITASLLFVFICSICLFENFFIEKQFGKASQALTSMKNEYLLGISINQSSFNKLKNDWNENKNLLSAFVNREQINKISDEISLLEFKYKYDTDEFLISAENIIILLDDIKKLEKINTYGLL